MYLKRYHMALDLAPIKTPAPDTLPRQAFEQARYTPDIYMLYILAAFKRLSIRPQFTLKYVVI